MKTIVVILLLAALALSAPDAPPAEENAGFFTPEELGHIDTALAMLNMTLKDASFDKLVIDDDWRLPVVNRALSRPLETADITWEWAERAADRPPALLEAAYEVIRPIAHHGGERLTAGEAETLARWAYAALVEEDGHDGLIPKPESDPSPEAMLALAGRVDLHERIQEAIGLLHYVASGELHTAKSSAQLELLREQGVRFAGPGDDVHDLRRDPPRILVDRGGNDRYIAPARAMPDNPVAIVLDLGGDDVYGNGESLSCGAGFFGVGILWDKGDGDDRYGSGHLSQGCGLFGVGVLIDEGGNDVYECRDTGQGAGAWGIGLLLDRGEGNDRFHADLFGQGFAYVGGFGLLHNEKGNEVYDAGGVHLHYPLFNDRFQSLSQGFSIGMRPYASGGVGLLVDDAGNDRYCCDIYGQGASYWFALGGLVDKSGNDTYNLGQYGQGGGIHLAAGCLLDLEGQDLYYNMHGVGTGGAHDFAVGILVDRKGDDYYAGSGGTMGGALTNSFALLLDAAGNDGYSAVKVRHAVGGGRSARGMGSIGLFLDLAGKDLAGTLEKNGTIWTKETYGAGIDLPDVPVPGKRPPPRAPLAPEEADRRVREAAWMEAEGRYDLEKLWDLARQWAVGEMSFVVPVALDRLVAMGEPAMEKALAEAASRDGLEFRAVQEVLKKFRSKATPRLREMLREEAPRRRARAALLLADLGAVAAAGEIVPLLSGEKTRLSALDALGRLKDSSVWTAVADQLTTGKERERVSALRCLQSLHAAEALPRVLGRTAGSEIFTVRFAAEDVLVSFGEDAVPLLLARLRQDGDLTSRRHAIRALGRIAPWQAVEPLAALIAQPDWRIRFDAAGALGEYVRTGSPSAVRARQLLAVRAESEDHPCVSDRIRQLLEPTATGAGDGR